MRRIEQETDKSLKGMRWTLLKDRSKLKPEAAAELDALVAKVNLKRTARAWGYKEQLREILERKRSQRWCDPTWMASSLGPKRVRQLLGVCHEKGLWIVKLPLGRGEFHVQVQAVGMGILVCKLECCLAGLARTNKNYGCELVKKIR